MIGLTPDPEIAEEDADGVDEAEAAQRVHRLERVVEEFAVVVDPRQPRPAEEVGAEHLPPQLLHRSDLGEEAVAADVEAEPLVFDGAGDAAHLPVLFEDDGGAAAAREDVRGSQPGRTAANDDMLSFRHQNKEPETRRG